MPLNLARRARRNIPPYANTNIYLRWNSGAGHTMGARSPMNSIELNAWLVKEILVH
jgi:hypothetical protein